MHAYFEKLAFNFFWENYIAMVEDALGVQTDIVVRVVGEVIDDT